MAYSYKKCVKPLEPTADQLARAKAFSEAAYLAVTKASQARNSSMHLLAITAQAQTRAPFQYKPPAISGISAVAWHMACRESSRQTIVSNNIQAAKATTAKPSPPKQTANKTAAVGTSSESHSLLPAVPEGKELPTATYQVSVIANSSQANLDSADARMQKCNVLATSTAVPAVHRAIRTCLQTGNASTAISDQTASHQAIRTDLQTGSVSNIAADQPVVHQAISTDLQTGSGSHFMPDRTTVHQLTRIGLQAGIVSNVMSDRVATAVAMADQTATAVPHVPAPHKRKFIEVPKKLKSFGKNMKTKLGIAKPAQA